LADTAHPASLSAPGGGPGRKESLFGDLAALGYGSGPIYDEMVTGDGRLRPHWRTFMSALGPLDSGFMGERWEAAARLLHQNGVTYNIYGDPQGMDRPWPLDLIPLLIPPDEWATIQAGVIQRATLLNRILCDLYGPQDLIRSGRLPPALIHADPGFLRPCHGITPTGGSWLHLYAVDLARAPDGRWWVLSDRTQTPSGAGYALENRVVVSRVLPEAFKDCNVHNLTPFFTALKESLIRLAPCTHRDPRMVLLTPGPYNETYFEHAFLARYLGITLVEGGDLTVRDNQVFLKTLSGLEPVDIILRRLDDDFCDSLELRADSSLGVAGLVQAVRAGTVTVANALGTGLVESLSFKPFMPMLCRYLLGEELKLPGVAMWWCGQEAEFNYVVSNLDKLVIKSAFARSKKESIFGSDLSKDERIALIARLWAQPNCFIAQEQVGLSTVPTWRDNRLQPRPLVMRVYLAATADGFTVMPGGLTRMSGTPGGLIVSMQKGGGSKDTWVLAPKRAPGATPAGRTGPVFEIRGAEPRTVEDPRTDIRSAPSDLPSRVADSLFWLGRYTERSESMLRVLRGVHVRLLDGARPGASDELIPLMRMMDWLGLIPRDLIDLAEVGTGRGVRQGLHAAVFDGGHPNSLRANVLRLHRTASGVRDRLSLDMWRVISLLDRQCEPTSNRPRIDTAMLLRLDDLMTTLAAIAGFEQESMTRGPAWRFLDMGRRLERALHTIALVRGTRIVDSSQHEAATLDVLLELGESVMTYRQRYYSAPQRARVLALLLRDDANPRSLAFQLGDLARHLVALPRPPAGTTASQDPLTAAKRLIDEARTTLSDLETIRDRFLLRQTLTELASDLPEVSNLLAHAYFSHAFARPA
jgi:uncharacterized circularly permuted ATP-grasp superfamily protein/uncharacterized alpha-E superfamily protein